jgi:hypothetical protein
VTSSLRKRNRKPLATLWLRPNTKMAARKHRNLSHARVSVDDHARIPKGIRAEQSRAVWRCSGT